MNSVLRGALAATALLPLSAHSGVITMKNGDRITGDVKRIWDGEVYIEPEYADEFTVDQSAVAAIEDDRPFEIEYRDGTKVTAGLVGGDPDGNQLVVVGGTVVAMPLARLAELDEPEKFSDWSMNFDVVTSLDKGNTDSEEFKFTGDILWKYGKRRHFIDLLFERENQTLTAEDGSKSNSTTKDRDLYQYNFNYELVDPWFLGAVGSYEKDPVRGLDNRYNLIPGIGYELWNDADKLFIIQFGLGFQSEDTTTSSESGSVAAGFARFRYDIGDPDLSLFLNNTTTKANFGRRNFISQFSTGVRYEITDLLYANVQLDYSYESEPEEGAEGDDLSLLFGIGVEFEN